jgi:hypothetical protein
MSFVKERFKINDFKHFSKIVFLLLERLILKFVFLGNYLIVFSRTGAIDLNIRKKIKIINIHLREG